MTFTADLKAFRDLVERRSRLTFVESVSAVKGSIVEGSAVTGAPGQPVDNGNLINSWQDTFPEDWVGQVATPVVYAPAVEEGQQPPYVTSRGTQVNPRPMTLRSAVGGFHSFKLTVAGWRRLLEDVVRRVAR